MRIVFKKLLYIGRPIGLVILLFVFISCSTTQTVDSNSIPISSKTWTNSALVCLGVGLLAGALAKKYSPNKASEPGNMLIFGSAGCISGGVASGYINHLKEKEEHFKQVGGDEYLYQNHVTPLRGIDE